MTTVEMILELRDRAEKARKVACDVIGWPYKGFDEDNEIEFKPNEVVYHDHGYESHDTCELPIKWLEMPEEELRKKLLAIEEEKAEQKRLSDEKSKQKAYESRKSTYAMLKIEAEKEGW